MKQEIRATPENVDNGMSVLMRINRAKLIEFISREIDLEDPLYVKVEFNLISD